MTSTRPVGVDDKLLMGKSVRSATTSTRPVGSSTLYVYFCCHMTNTGPGRMGDKIIGQSV